MTVPNQQSTEPRLGNHWVAFYEDDAELYTPLTQFVREGLEQGDGILMIATPDHQSAVAGDIEAPLLDELRERGRYREIDAAAAVDRCSQRGTLSEPQFSGLVSAEVAAARRASTSGEVRVFGEAVGILTGSGRFDDAIELEQYWNRFLTRHEIALFCAYPLAHFPTALHRAKLESICLTHTHVEARPRRSASFDGLRAAVDRVVLEQQARALLRETRQRAALEEELSLRKAELAQARRLEAIALLGGGIAHDFNNFLTVIDSATDYLLDTCLPDEEQRRAVLDIRAASERASALSARLLALTGSKHHAPRTVDPNDIVRGLSRLFRQVLRQQAELSLELDDAIGCISADPGHIEQVLLNLVVNARDAVNGHGKIVLRTRQRRFGSPAEAQYLAAPALVSGNYATFEVSDNGSGISDTVKARLFEPFFTTKANGFGLGLSTVRTLVQQNGGQVSVTSVPGQGTTFSLFFPEVRASALPS